MGMLLRKFRKEPQEVLRSCLVIMNWNVFCSYEVTQHINFCHIFSANFPNTCRYCKSSLYRTFFSGWTTLEVTKPLFELLKDLSICPPLESTDLDVNSLVDFPDLYKKPHKAADDHNRVSLIVHNIQQNYDRLEDIEEHRPNRKAFQCLATSPELDVWKC